MRSNEQLVHIFLEEIQRGKVDQFLNCLTPNAEIHVCLGNQLYTDSYAGTFVGKRGARNLFNLCRQFFEFHKIVATEFHHDKHKMIIRGDLKCDLLSNNETWNSSWMQIWTFEKESVSKVRIFADYTVIPRTQLAEMKQNIGVLEMEMFPH